MKSFRKNKNQEQQPAFQHVRENIDDLNGRTGVQDTDLIFLKGLMDSPIMKSLVKVQDRLEDSNGSLEPVATNSADIISEVAGICQRSRHRDAQELSRLLQEPHLKSLLEAHDTVASKSYRAENEEQTTTTLPDLPLNGIPADAIRMVGLRKNPNEPLGVTVKIENGELVIARILEGGMIDRQGLLHVGDVIKEVNGAEVYTPEELQEQLRKADTTVNLKIIPSYIDYPDTQQDPPRKIAPPRSPRTGHKQTIFGDNLPTLPCYVKALFSYDPKKDTLLPCTEIGLPFKQGEVLQVLNTQDPNWWQARKVNSPKTGLIPSQELEERRKAFVRPECDYVTKTSICGTRIARKKKKQMYQFRQNADFDKAELVLYEEVARMPPFQRKTLVLVGPQGIGRRSLKNRLVGSDPERFGTVIPYTSRPCREGEVNGRNYYFTTREEMEDDIAENKYLEHGEFNSFLYGTKLDTIQHVIKSGKMCVLDCNPQGLKTLNVPEYMPFVVFIAAPNIDSLRQLHESKPNSNSKVNLTFDRALIGRQSRRARTLESLSSILEEDDLRRTVDESARLQKSYEKYFDLTINNDDFERTYETLLKAVNALSTDPQWVPVSWVY